MMKVYVVLMGESGESVPVADYPSAFGAYTNKRDALKRAREIRDCYKGENTEIMTEREGAFIEMTDVVEDSHMVIVVQQVNVNGR